VRAKVPNGAFFIARDSGRGGGMVLEKRCHWHPRLTPLHKGEGDGGD